MKHPALVAVTGKGGSGKGAVCKRLEAHGFNTLYPGEMIRSKARSRGVNLPNRTASALFTLEMRREFGVDVLIRPALEASSPVAVDGIRMLYDADRLKKAGGYIVAVNCEDRACFKHIQADPERDANRKPDRLEAYIEDNRSDFGETVVPEDVTAEEAALYLPSLGEVMELADYQIDNNSAGFDSLHEQVDAMAVSILSRCV